MTNPRVVDALRRPSRERSEEDIKNIFHYLRQLDVFGIVADGPLSTICQTARLERHPKDHVLFRRGQSATCWYILISGSVLMNNQVYLPSGCFGKRNGMNLRRSSDCLVIQPSDMIVIDYTDVQRIPVHYQSQTSHGHSNSSSASNTLTRSSVQHHPVQIQQPQQANFLQSQLNFYAQEQFSQRSSHFPAQTYKPPPPATHFPHQSAHIVLHDEHRGRWCGAVLVPLHGHDYSDATLTAPWKNAHLHANNNAPSANKRVPSPAPRSASISISHSPQRRGDLENEARRKPVDMDVWAPNREHLPSVPQHSYAPRPLPVAKLTASTTSAANLPSNDFNLKRNSLHEAHLAQLSLLDSFDSGIQVNRSSGGQPFDSTSSASNVSSSTGTSVPPPAPAANPKFPYPGVSHDDGDHFLAPSAHRINKMRVQLNRKNSDGSTSSGVKIRSASGNATSAMISATSRRLRGRSTASSSTTDGDEFAGLPETAVDSDDDDEESIPSHDYSFVELKDNVRECLEKEPSQRTSDDIHVLMEFMQQMPALASLPLSIKRQLCLKMVFAVVPEAGTVILHHGEKIDSWSVIVNGAVEHVRQGERITEYRLGDAFGAEPVPRHQFMDGEMRTLVDDCEFVLVEHEAYCSIMSTLNQHIEKENDQLTGEVVREAERRMIGSQVALVVIKAKPDRLVQHLVEEGDSSIDENFVPDFLLMYRVFIFDPTEVMHKIIEWFADGRYREKVTRIVLLWVNNHFNDFESNKEMLRLLDHFESCLEKSAMYTPQSLLNITCSIKSRPRQVTLTRSNREQELAFSVIGGNVHQPNAPATDGVFVASVEPGSPAEKNGVKRGDEILEVNGQPFRSIPLNKALDVLRESTHLSLTLKSNMMGFKEILMKHETASGSGTMGRYQKKSPLIMHGRRSTLNPALENGVSSTTPKEAPPASNSPATSSHSHGGGGKTVFGKLKTIQRFDRRGKNRTTALRASRSNPDIAGHLINPTATLPHTSRNPHGIPEQAVKVYRSDQTFRYLAISPQTTAKHIVENALNEFGMTDSVQDWALCECICSVVNNGESKAEKKIVIKQRRLPDDMHNLAERIGLSSRLYLKNNLKSETLIPDELASDFVAIQLTLQDFDVFSSIEPTEYVDNLFQLESRYGWPTLTHFEELFNREMWWVVTEVCLERSVAKRVKIIKKFIKIARHCRDLRNFNSMFAIVSGLEKPSVRRLTHTWERIPGKYLKMFNDIQQFMDPSRNMSKYRQHLKSVSAHPPVIPIYPVLRKDLTFSHEAKPTYCDSLINFEKLRMIARIIGSVTLLCSVKYDLDFMSNQAVIGEMSATGTVRKLATSSGTVKSLGNMSRKKLYEQTLMKRKVKNYLTEMPIIDNENELDQLSLSCEPNPLQQPKFGVDSPQAIQKMLGLVQHSKVKTQANASPRLPSAHGNSGSFGSPMQSRSEATMSVSRPLLQKLRPASTALLVCDLQGRFRDAIIHFPEIVKVAKRMIDGAKLMDMQVLASEQYPKGLGKLVPELGIHETKVPVFEKLHFSMCIPDLCKELKPEIKSILICGIEAHVCVYQSVLDFLDKGYAVQVVVDATSSRAAPDRFFGFKQMERAGAVLTTSECALMGLLGGSEHPKFRDIQKIIMESAPDTGLLSYVSHA
ncbi:RasGEF domain-containing protein [Aphelenchoides fujianensis]|nr:RasGEF domain-containing protein [Aphelenchoides fujianensis]